MNREMNSENVVLDAAHRLDGDTPCQSCGYNLRTLSRDAHCPECGTAVSLSLPKRCLRDADRQWLSMVQMGVLFVTAGCLARSFSDFRYDLWEIIRPRGNAQVVLNYLAMFTSSSVGMVLMTAGIWAASRAEPGELIAARPARRRKWAVAASMTALGIRLFDWLFLVVGVSLGAGYYQVAGLAIPIFLIAGIGLFMSHVAILAERLPHERIVRWAKPIYLSLIIVVGLDVVYSDLVEYALRRLLSLQTYLNTQSWVALTSSPLYAAVWLAVALWLAAFLAAVHKHLKGPVAAAGPAISESRIAQ